MLRLGLGLVALSLCASLTQGCSNAKGPGIVVRVARPAMAGRCTATQGMSVGDDPSVPASGITQFRVSVRQHVNNDLKGQLLCDRVLPATESFFKIIPEGATSLDLIAEGFSESGGSFRRVATGALFGVPIGSETVPTLRLYPTATSRCVDSRLKTGRAFHTATVLPTGHVLIVGGAVASASDATRENLEDQRLFVTGSAEIWDPLDGKFYDVTEGATTPRAFHHAALLSSPNGQPPYQVLLVGGVTTDDTKKAVLGANPGNIGGARLVPFEPPLLALPTKVADPEIITIDPILRTASRAKTGAFVPAAFQAAAVLDERGLATATGIKYLGDGSVDATPAKSVTVFADGVSPRAGTTGFARMGASLTQLFGGNALLWGGGLTLTDGLGEFISGVGSTGSVASMPIAAVTGPHTQFHTATAFSRTASSASVLITGGFAINPVGVPNPPPPNDAVRIIATATAGTAVVLAPAFVGYTTPATCVGGDRYKSAGFESAVALASGKILITGGTPRGAAATCNDCDTGGGLLCSIAQASLFTPPTTFAKMDPLQIGRVGHASVELKDGTVLITGGLTGGDMPRTVADAEVYNPRTQVPPSPDRDDPVIADLVGGLTRKPGEVAHNGASADPAFCTPEKCPCPDL